MPDPLLLRAALTSVVPRRPRRDTTALTRDAVRADPAALAAYARECGLRPDGTLPVLYPHVLAFGLAMRLMVRRDFPFPLPGLVHVRDTVTRHRRIDPGEPLALTVLAHPPQEHPRGRTVDVVTDVRAADTPVWSETSTFLRREHGERRSHADSPQANDDAAQPRPRRPDEPRWPDVARFDADAGTGRRYASVSGDRNPIHLWALTARPFGFSRPIAHGMWTAARALGALGAAVPDASRVVVEFAAPVLLPAALTLATDPDGAPSTTGFLVRSDEGRVHLTGRVGQPGQDGDQRSPSS